MKSSHNLRNAGACAVVSGVVFVTASVRIAFGATQPVYQFDIQPGEITTRLEEFYAITHVPIVRDARLKGLTRGVRGTYTADEGLWLLLEGTPLVCEHLESSSHLSVHPKRDRQPERGCLPPPLVPRTPPPDQTLPTPAKEVDEVKVRAPRRKLGTLSHDASEVGSELLDWDQKAIVQSGAQSLPDLLETTQNFEGGATQDTHVGSTEATSNSGLGTGENLRGLGSRSTLVLFNGHRVAPSGNDASFTDQLQFPLSFIQNVSELPDGLSGLYGSAAVGGVINVDTPDHYTQAVSHLEAGTVTQGHQENYLLSQSLGTRWDSGSVLVIADLMQWDRLPAYERALANTARLPFAYPGNLFTGGLPYPIPSGRLPGLLDLATLNPGLPQLVNPQLDADIFPSQKRRALYGSFNQRLTPFLSLWTYVSGAERTAGESTGPQEVSLNVSQSPYLLRPSSQPVFYTSNLFDTFGVPHSSVTVRTLNTATELRFDLPRDWQLVLSGSDSVETEAQDTSRLVDAQQLQTLVSSQSLATAFNPFGNSPESVLASLDAPKRFESRSQLWCTQALADGKVRSLDDAPLLGAVGLEACGQHFAWSLSEPATQNDLYRHIYSAFTELQIPLLGPQRPDPFRALSVSVAGRIEEYTRFGQVASSRGGVEWRPEDHLKIQGAIGKSVRAPDIGDLSLRTNSSFAQTVDGQQVLVWSGGNPSLTKESALTKTAGFTLYFGKESQRLTFDVDYFDIWSRHRIQQPALVANILMNPQYANYITYNPDQALLHFVCNNSTFITTNTGQSCPDVQATALVDSRLQNAGTLWTDGIDARARLSVASGVGTWNLDIAGTYVLDYRQATLPTAPLVSVLNTEDYPLALHLLGGLGWELGGVHANVTVRYANSYTDNETQPFTHVGSWTRTDLRLGYTFGTDDSPDTSSLEIAVFVRNLFNTYPAFSNSVIEQVGYDQENGDLNGRQVKLSVHIKW